MLSQQKYHSKIKIPIAVILTIEAMGTIHSVERFHFAARAAKCSAKPNPYIVLFQFLVHGPNIIPI